MKAWFNGEWIDADAPALGVHDRGFTLGDGLFETMLWNGDAIARVERHAQRLHDSAAALDLPAPPNAERIDAIARELIAANAIIGAASVRLSFSAGQGARGLTRPPQLSPILAFAAAPYQAPQTPANVISSSIPRAAGSLAARHKTLSYIDNVMARREAEKAGADEALVFNARDFLAGGAASNVFAALDGEIRTPPIEDGALPGTMRATLLDAFPQIAVRSIPRRDLARATALWISNALTGARRVTRLDARALSDAPFLLDEFKI